jgi:hypothetical protein
MAKEKEKKQFSCFLYDSKKFKYPNGKLVTELSERDELLKNGFNTGPVDKAKAASRAKQKAEIKKDLEAEAKAELKAEADAKKAKEAAKA